MTLYRNNIEAAFHHRAIEALAVEEGQPFVDVERLYEQELAQIKAAARVQNFVATFARRRTQTAIRRRSRPHQSALSPRS